MFKSLRKSKWKWFRLVFTELRRILSDKLSAVWKRNALRKIYAINPKKELNMPRRLMKKNLLTFLSESVWCQQKESAKGKLHCRRRKSRCCQYEWSSIWPTAGKRTWCLNLQAPNYLRHQQESKMNKILYYHLNHPKVLVQKANQLPLLMPILPILWIEIFTVHSQLILPRSLGLLLD